MNKVYIVLDTTLPRFINAQEYYDTDTIVDEVFDSEEKAKERKSELDRIYRGGPFYHTVGIVERIIK